MAKTKKTKKTKRIDYDFIENQIVNKIGIMENSVNELALFLRQSQLQPKHIKKIKLELFIMKNLTISRQTFEDLEYLRNILI